MKIHVNSFVVHKKQIWKAASFSKKILFIKNIPEERKYKQTFLIKEVVFKEPVASPKGSDSDGFAKNSNKPLEIMWILFQGTEKEGKKSPNYFN